MLETLFWLFQCSKNPQCFCRLLTSCIHCLDFWQVMNKRKNFAKACWPIGAFEMISHPILGLMLKKALISLQITCKQITLSPFERKLLSYLTHCCYSYSSNASKARTGLEARIIMSFLYEGIYCFRQNSGQCLL